MHVIAFSVQKLRVENISSIRVDFDKENPSKTDLPEFEISLDMIHHRGKGRSYIINIVSQLPIWS